VFEMIVDANGKGSSGLTIYFLLLGDVGNKINNYKQPLDWLGNKEKTLGSYDL